VVTSIGQINSTISSLKTWPRQIALDLYDLRFNIFPQPFGKKGELDRKQFQDTVSDSNKHSSSGRHDIANIDERASKCLFII